MTLHSILLTLFTISFYPSTSQAQSVLTTITTTTSTNPNSSPPATTTHSGRLLTGSCSLSFKTSAITTVYHNNSFHGTETASNGSVYVPVSFSERATLLYSTVGCLANQTACCPYPATVVSATASDGNLTSSLSVDDPTLTACPTGYSTTYYTPPLSSASSSSTTSSATTPRQTLCCPSGWGVYDHTLPDAGDTHPCFSEIAPYIAQDGQPGEGQPGNISFTGTDGLTFIHVYAVFTRSYLVQVPAGASSGSSTVDSKKTKMIVEIVVPVVFAVVMLAFCSGVAVRWWKEWKMARRTKQPEEAEGTISELGGGGGGGGGGASSRYEMEGRPVGTIKTSELDSKTTPLHGHGGGGGGASKDEKTSGVELDSTNVKEIGATNAPTPPAPTTIPTHAVDAREGISPDQSTGRAELM